MDSQDNRRKSDDALDAVKQSLHAKDVVDVDEELVKIILFRCGEGLYAFHGRYVREILPRRDIHPLPSLPDYLPGLINVRGEIETVVDIGFFLGEKRREKEAGMILMAVREGFRTGVLIDAVEDVVDVPASAITPPLSTLSGAVKELAAAEVEWMGASAVLLDFEKLEAKVTL